MILMKETELICCSNEQINVKHSIYLIHLNSYFSHNKCNRSLNQLGFFSVVSIKMCFDFFNRHSN